MNKVTLGSILHLTLILSCFSIGVYVYSKGFLLTRTALQDRSTSHCVSDNCKAASSTKSLYRRVIILVIDALRYDFLEWQQSVSNSSNQSTNFPIYYNQLPVVQNLIKSRPQEASIHKFISDPPTTTLQRLQSLTTGTLPTFIDAGSNFAGSSISEDSWVEQAVSDGRRIAFLGDDTWTYLYPTQFAISHPFPSFDVHDLDTVDNGIRRHLNGLLESNPGTWDILIAHFLGVDHCGHKYGPHHPEIRRKLGEMDDVIRDTVERMDNDTILFVFGDHGMTMTGDHGGDSPDEVTAGLFVFGPGLQMEEHKKDSSAIRQLNFVPTLSFIMGLPIPFSNLGRIATELLGTNWNQAVIHGGLMQNMEQILRYVDAYCKATKDPSIQARNAFIELRSLHEALASSSDLTALFAEDPHLANRIVKLLDAVRDDLATTWIQFNHVFMACGILVLLAAWLSCFCLAFCPSMTSSLGQLGSIRELLKLVFLLGSSLSAVHLKGALIPVEIFPEGYRHLLEDHLEAICALIMSFLVILIALVKLASRLPKLSEFWDHVDFTTTVTLIIVVSTCVSELSNSYIVNAHEVHAFMLKSSLILLAMSAIQDQAATYVQLAGGVNKRTKTGVATTTKLRESLSGIKWSAVALLIALICITLLSNGSGWMWLRCREELGPACGSEGISVFLTPFASLPSEAFKWARYVVALSALATVVGFTIWFLRNNGCLVKEGMTTLVGVKIMLPLSAILIGVHWTGEWLPERALVRQGWIFNIIIPRLVYGMYALFLALLTYDPVMACYELIDESSKQQQRSTTEPWLAEPQGTANTASVPLVYKYMAKNWKQCLVSSGQSSGTAQNRSRKRTNYHQQGGDDDTTSAGGRTKQLRNNSAGAEYSVESVDEVPEDQEQQQPEATLAVYGLATGYSGPWIAVIGFTTLILMMISGSGTAPVYPIIIIVGLAVLELLLGLHRARRFLVLTLFSELTAFAFFATGHQPTFPAIPWRAAFVGFSGNFAVQAVPATLITLDIFASEVLTSGFLVAAVFWTIYPNKITLLNSFAETKAKSTNGEQRITEADLVNSDSVTMTHVVSWMLAFFTVASTRVCFGQSTRTT